MNEPYDALVILVVIGAFVVGYLVVGFVIRYLKELKERPPLNEEIWRQQTSGENEKHLAGRDRTEGSL